MRLLSVANIPAVKHPYPLGIVMRIVVSLSDDQVNWLCHVVRRGRSASVSVFISDAIARAEREDSLAELLDDLDQELDPVSQDDVAWTNEALGGCRTALPDEQPADKWKSSDAGNGRVRGPETVE